MPWGGGEAWGSPCVECQKLQEGKEGVFSFFPVYLMADGGGVSVQRLLISQGFVWGAVEGAHTWQSLLPTGRASRGAAWAGLSPKVCVQGNVAHDTCKCMPAVPLCTPPGQLASTCVHGGVQNGLALGSG